MELSFVGLIVLIAVYIIFKKAVNCWVRIIEKLSAKAEQWVDDIDLSSSKD